MLRSVLSPIPWLARLPSSLKSTSSLRRTRTRTRTRTSPIALLPSEILLLCFLHLPPPTILRTVQLVSRRWRSAAQMLLGGDPPKLALDVDIKLTSTYHPRPLYLVSVPTFYPRFVLALDPVTGRGLSVAGRVEADVPRMRSGAGSSLLNDVAHIVRKYRKCDVHLRVRVVDIAALGEAQDAPVYSMPLLAAALQACPVSLRVDADAFRKMESYLANTNSVRRVDSVRRLVVDVNRATAAATTTTRLNKGDEDDMVAMAVKSFPNLCHLSFDTSLPPLNLNDTPPDLPHTHTPDTSRITSFLCPYSDAGGTTDPLALADRLRANFSRFPNLSLLGYFQPLDAVWSTLASGSTPAVLPTYTTHPAGVAILYTSPTLPAPPLPSPILDRRLEAFATCLGHMFPLRIPRAEVRILRAAWSPQSVALDVALVRAIVRALPVPLVTVRAALTGAPMGGEKAWCDRVVAEMRAEATTVGKVVCEVGFDVV